MRVKIISKTIQEFDGMRFYRGKATSYFQKTSKKWPGAKRLHRIVWQYHHGKIAPGDHVHHKNEDKSDNQIENLAILEGRRHISLHLRSPERQKISRRVFKQNRLKAALWHSSPQGRLWHSKKSLKMWKEKRLLANK